MIRVKIITPDVEVSGKKSQMLVNISPEFSTIGECDVAENSSVTISVIIYDTPFGITDN